MMKGIGESSDDRISQLPENVIHRILMLLPIKDAAKTSFMSTKWRYHWRSIPRLVFDEGFAQIIEPTMMDKLILKIFKSLLVHDGPIPEFVLTIPGLTPCDELDHIIVHVSGRGVQEFTLVLSSEDSYIYKLPSSLFRAVHLNHLKLERCLFMEPAWFVGFGKLTILELRKANIRSGFFENFLSKCASLKELTKICFKHTPLLAVLRLSVVVFHKPDLVGLFSSLPALQRLHIGSAFLKLLAEGACIPTSLPTPLHRLQDLSAHGLVSHSVEMKRVLFCLILSARTLIIKLNSNQLNQPTSDDAETCIESMLVAGDNRGSELSLQYLRVFKLEHSLGLQFELELVRFVLATAPLLLRVQIKPHHQLSSIQIIKFLKEVMQYKRISKNAEVFYEGE